MSKKITIPMVGGLVVGGLVAIALVVESYHSDDELLRVYLLVGASLGWLIGILAVPLNPKETSRFGQFAKIIAGFLTGYILSKFDPLILWFVTDPGDGRFPIFETEIQTRVLFSLAGFIVSMIIIFNARSYWSPSSNSAQDRVAAD